MLFRSIADTEGIITQDGFKIGIYGDLKIRISNVKTFYIDIVGGRQEWTLSKLKDWIKGLLHTSFRDIFKIYPLNGILRENRETVINKVIAKISVEFSKYGLDMESCNILGIKTPESAQKILDQQKDSTLLSNEIIATKQDFQMKDQKETLIRISNLKKKLQELQDNLIDGTINEDEFQRKSRQIQQFIEQAEQQLCKD